ncbi:MAG: VCBS repeat-containing protein [Dokdonella sp.]
MTETRFDERALAAASTGKMALMAVLLISTIGSPEVHAVEFTTRHDFSVGNVPFSIAASDLNGDGKIDLIVANGSDQTLSVLINNTELGAGTPSFDEQHILPCANGPTAISVADINGDGKPDLIAPSFNGTISILLNQTPVGSASASFASSYPLSGITEVRSVAIADMNGDGKPDVITNVESISAVSVWINTTSTGAVIPSFNTMQTFDAGWTPMAVAAADLNGDGKPDLIAANNYYYTVSVMMNATVAGESTISLSSPQQFSTGEGTFSVVTADVNEDGKADVIVGNAGADTLSVLRNATATGGQVASFETQQVFAAGDRPIAVFVGDVNGDGKPDLLSANYNGSSVSVLINTTVVKGGATSFAPHQDFPVGIGARSVVAADLNGDGMPDLGIANSGANTASVLINETAPYNLLFASGFD